MKKKNLFIICTIACALMIFCCGADSLFENPIGLIAFSAVFSTIFSALLIGIYALVEKINPNKTKKFIEFILRED